MPDRHSRPVSPSAMVRATTESQSSPDRKSTRLNSSYTVISYAVFCLKKKKKGHGTIAKARPVQRMERRPPESSAPERQPRLGSHADLHEQIRRDTWNHGTNQHSMADL